MGQFDFSQWPPSLTDVQLETLTHHATTYALAHGLVYLPPASSQPSSPTSTIHAPISLLPVPVPRSLFQIAQRLQSVYNTLYARIAVDDDFLDQVMGAEVGVGQADDFVKRLWQGWKAIREEGIAQPLHLGLFRSDYLLHTGTDHAIGLKQVEFNTISSSFGALSDKVAAMHRYLHALTDYYHISPYLKSENFPPNNTTSGLAQGLAEAHNAYGVQSAYILFVVQPNERNVFDQRCLEYELLEKHSIRVVRQTFLELAISASLSGPSRTLLLDYPNSGSDLIEISTAYFRAGYVPTDLPTETHWTARLTLERSRAIKCPSIPLQLAGGKKVQEVLSQPGVVERFFPTLESVTTASAAAELRETWMPMWALDTENPPALSASLPEVERNPGEPLGTTFARRHADKLVLKPQREGGGNNVYKGDIPAFLEGLSGEERRAWIAMALIVPPTGIGSYLVRAMASAGGTGTSGSEEREKLVRAETISELGIFGWALFGKDQGTGVVRKERGDVGWLMRTKGVESNEGGVAAGFSVLDSVVLVNG